MVYSTIIKNRKDKPAPWIHDCIAFCSFKIYEDALNEDKDSDEVEILLFGHGKDIREFNVYKPLLSAEEMRVKRLRINARNNQSKLSNS